MKQRLLDLLPRLRGQKVLVLGDLMIDEYIWGQASRISPEAPVPVVEVERESFVLGGASNVANNMQSLGGEVLLLGVVGQDEPAARFREFLSGQGMADNGLVTDFSRPTTVKTRVIAQNQQVLRIDREDKTAVSPEVEEKLLEFVKQSLPQIGAVIISDYAKGVITKSLAAEIIALVKAQQKIVAVDPKGNDYSKYKGATILTPNLKETECALGEKLTSEEKIVAGGGRLRRELELDYLLVTRGADGMSLLGAGECWHIPAVASKVYDVTGAGDTVISVLTLALAAGASFREAMLLANYAAAVVVKKLGTSTVSLAEIADIIKRN